MMKGSNQNDEALTSLLSLLQSKSAGNDYENGNSSQMRYQRRSMPPTDRSRTDASSKSLTIEDLRNFFHLPIVEVAKQLGTCTTALKKVCRKNNIMKWPYRQIRSITKSIQSLEMASLNDTLPEELKFQYREQVFELQKAIDEIVRNPNADVSLHLMNNFEIEGDDFDENENENENGESQSASKRYTGPSTSVMQIMQAAAATAGFESTSSKISSNTANTKRKREEETLKALKDEVTPDIPAPTIGSTTVGVVSNAEPHRGVQYVGPVHLAPLQRKKITTSKKLVPLIEPDICNHYKMEFLPNSILHHSDKIFLENSVLSYMTAMSNSSSDENVMQSAEVSNFGFSAAAVSSAQSQQHNDQVSQHSMQPHMSQHQHVQQQQPSHVSHVHPQQVQQHQGHHHQGHHHQGHHHQVQPQYQSQMQQNTSDQASYSYETSMPAGQQFGDYNVAADANTTSYNMY